MSVIFESHKDEAINEMENSRKAALEAIGSKCAGYASMLAPVDTGRLKNSMEWSVVSDDTVCIGTNVEYAAYQEMGTSKIPPHPFLRPAVENHMDEYKEIAKAILSSSN